MNEKKRRKAGRWTISKISSGHGYLKLKHVATGDSAYAAFLSYRNCRSRASFRIFSRAQEAADHHRRVMVRLQRLKAAQNGK